MIYTIKKGETTYSVDDNKTLSRQSEEFIKAFNTFREADMSEFDNAYILLMNGRLVITIKYNEEEDTHEDI